MKPAALTEQKWVYEIILEKVPPFSLVPRGYNVVLQLLLMETIGIAAAAVFKLPTQSILYGSLVILAVWTWSFLAFLIGPTVRRLRSPSAHLEKNVIDEYKKSLFSPRRRELGFALLILSFISLYLFFERNLVTLWFNGNPPPVLLLLATILLWDVSYRLGLGLWLAIVAFKRSVNLVEVSEMRGKMRYTSYEDLNTLKRLDLINLSFGAVTLLFYPLVSSNLIFFATLLLYSAGISVLSALSYVTISRIPGYPKEINWLLTEGKFGYVGTSDKQMNPHLTPVIYAFDGHQVFFLVSKISKKLRNIAENPNIAFLVDMRDPNNLYNNRAVLITGKARVYSVLDASLHLLRVLRVRSLFNKKYPEYIHHYRTRKELLPRAWRTTIFVSRMLVSVEVRKIVYWRQARAIRLPLK